MSEPGKSVEIPPHQIAESQRLGMTKRPNVGFFYAGMLFLIGGLVLFFFGGLLLSQIKVQSASTMNDKIDFWVFFRDFLKPGMFFLNAILCTLVGISLLKAAGALYREVIPRGEYELLAQLIKDGNEKAITEYIRLSSLSGATGTFTKIGLTGLPLATIVLTIILAILGLIAKDNSNKLFDFAQLTLGAFIGSYVQKKRERPE